MNWFLLASISAVFSAIAAISQKKILFTLNALEFSFFVSVFGFVFSIPFFFYINYAELTSASLLILFIKSILGALAFLCVMLSIKNLEISKALPLMALTPGFVAFFAFIFLGETLSASELTGLMLLLVGVYILETKPVQTLFEPFHIFLKSKNYRYVILALLLFTATSILDKLLLKEYKLPPIGFMAFQQLFFAITFGVIYLFSRKEGNHLIKSFDKKILMLIVLVAILTIGYRYTQINATKIAPVSLVLAVKRTSVFFAALIGGKMFDETNLLKKAVAAAIIIGGSLLILQE
ncbi:MAG: EamA family transporter [Ignavibacteriales bacterium]|nr:EamA family transporter [Ignavibacteriales bacterium]